MDDHIFKQLDALERGTRNGRSHALIPRGEVIPSQLSDWRSTGALSDYERAIQAPAHGVLDEYTGRRMDVDALDERRPYLYDSGTQNVQVSDAFLQQRSSYAVSREHVRVPRDRHHDPPSFAHFGDQPAFVSSSPPPQQWLSSPTPGGARHVIAASNRGQTCGTSLAVSPEYEDIHNAPRPHFTLERLEPEERSGQNVSLQPIADTAVQIGRAPSSNALRISHRSLAPIVQGITLVSTREIPDSFRSLFHFPFFNAVQSKCFETIYYSNDNFVLSSPTSSGKTVILELAICRLINSAENDSYKIVYQAPTKSLCAERYRDWQAKFGPLGLQCAALTGDTEGGAQLRSVQNATIIVTTPEKWDSMTRKWKDHQRLMLMVKLFLIDEVHILKEDRGATLEAVVSRMKSVESNVRFVALSATVPNLGDIASWLGQDQAHPWLPAAREVFGEEFRPVRLQKHVCGYTGAQNEFAFEKILTSKLTEVICKYSQNKPIMIFCFTRNSCVETAKLLAEWWKDEGPAKRFWHAPQKHVAFSDKELQSTVSAGVAFHHAGLGLEDRTTIEKSYHGGKINVICCTSTLAVGVNLPCHMVIIKHTVSYGGPGVGCKEYSDLEVMQMLGRAGRPQFDDTAVAVIMTRSQKVPYYEKMIAGSEVLESCLHLNLIDHLNSEIGLGTITNASTAKKWLKGTFLYVRLKENPEHYKIDGSTPGRTLDERLENICRDGIAALENHNLVTSQPKLHCTEFGDAMARYYLQFGTMKILLSLPPQSKVSEILSAISQATEFADLRFRANEKPTYKELNKSASIKFPIPVNLDSPAHKVSLIIQSVLGAVELPTEDAKQRNEFATAKSLIFLHANRFVKCIIDCQLHIEDSIAARNALMLSRSLGTQVWDDSPLHMKQLDAIGIVSVRKLATAQIRSIEELENADAQRIETILSRNPPFGSQTIANAKLFPKLRVSLKTVGDPLIKKGEHVTIRVNVEIGFLNEKVPEYFNKRPVYVCMLAERSDGHVVHFARASAKNLIRGQDIVISAKLLNASQSVRVFVMCDELAGTMRFAILKPDIPTNVFPPPQNAEEADKHSAVSRASRKRAAPGRDDKEIDEFGDAGIDDDDLAHAEDEAFTNIDDIDDLDNGSRIGSKSNAKKQKIATAPSIQHPEPRQLPNGKWACNHACKDKTSCKHMCCREGLDKHPKPRAAKKEKVVDPAADLKQMRLKMPASKERHLERPIYEGVPADLHGKSNVSNEARDLSRLHDSIVQSTRTVPMLGSVPLSAAHKNDLEWKLSFLSKANDGDCHENGSDALSSNDLPDASSLVKPQTTLNKATKISEPSEIDDDDDMLNLLGLEEISKASSKDKIIDLSSQADHSDTYSTVQKRGRKMPCLNGGPSNSTLKNSKTSSPLFLHDSTSSSALVPSSPPKLATPISDCVRGTPISKASTPAPHPIVHEGYVATTDPIEDITTTIIDDPMTLPDLHAEGSNIQPTKDPLAAWFEQEFGTELFNYIG